MVLESLFPASEIENKPIDMLVLSLIVGLVSVFVAWWLYPSAAGVIFPLLVTIGMTPVTYRLLAHEEEIEAKVAEGKIKKGFIERHGETILLFGLFFIGIFLAVFIIVIAMPEDFVGKMFAQQLADITAISKISQSGQAIITGEALLNPIINNNLRVMLFAFTLSLLFATGALFILSWNASILAIFLASLLKQGLYEEFILKTIGIIPHVPFEMGAYFIAGIAGGMLSAGAIRENIGSPEFNLVLKDSLIMLGIAITAILIGGALEVYI